MLARLTLTAQTAHRALLDLLFPPRCVSCRREGVWFCVACQSRIEKINPPLCQRCGRASPTDLCTFCQQTPLRIDGIRSFAFFEGVMRDAIHRFKYNRRVELAPIFGDMLNSYLSVHPLPADIVVPVPLHAERERARGYNQALLIAQELGARLKLPVLAGALTRIRMTRSQTELNAIERRDNVRGAFAADARVAGARVLLVDDVCTTGATMDECSIALRNRGAQWVWGLALARGR